MNPLGTDICPSPAQSANRGQATACLASQSLRHNRLVTRWAALSCAAAAVLFATVLPLHAQTTPEDGFVSLFDGKTLDGWKIGDNADVFQVHDGMVVMECPKTNHQPAHLFYEGDVNGHAFKNFDLRVDVMTYPCANSGIYFHTKFQKGGWPRLGLECQVNNSHVDWRRTGSLYGIKNISWGPEAPSADNKEDVLLLPTPEVTDKTWYTQEIICHDETITVKLNGKTMLEYKMPEMDAQHKLSTGVTWLPEGTFALQGHPPMENQISKACFKNIRVKVLAD
jgi:hypothetical protein